jgi:hypothetical protein
MGIDVRLKWESRETGAVLLFANVIGCAGPPAPPSARPVQAPSSEPPALQTAATERPARRGILEIRASRTGGTLYEQHLYVRLDGQILGPLPGRFEDLPAGAHELKIQDDEQRYAVVTEQITIDAGKTVEYAPALVVVKGLITIRQLRDAPEAKIWLRMRSDMRALPTLPLRIDITEPTAPYSVIAMPADGVERVYPFDFNDGVAIKSVTIPFQLIAYDKWKG